MDLEAVKEIRDQTVEEWRDFVWLHGGFDKETGMPRKPDMLPINQDRDLRTRMTFWNKEVARVAVTLDIRNSNG